LHHDLLSYVLQTKLAAGVGPPLDHLLLLALEDAALRAYPVASQEARPA
jgi:hypothetical protein